MKNITTHTHTSLFYSSIAVLNGNLKGSPNRLLQVCLDRKNATHTQGGQRDSPNEDTQREGEESPNINSMDNGTNKNGSGSFPSTSQAADQQGVWDYLPENCTIL